MISTLFGLSETRSGPKMRQVTQYTTTSLNNRASKTNNGFSMTCLLYKSIYIKTSKIKSKETVKVN